jgi:hypothetical protein
MNVKYETNNYNLSDYEHFKLVSAFQEATEDAKKNGIRIPIHKLVDELMLDVINKIQKETGASYLNPGCLKSFNKFLNL